MSASLSSISASASSCLQTLVACVGLREGRACWSARGPSVRSHLLRSSAMARACAELRCGEPRAQER
eukprot:31054-Rhodomonas_salina.2